MRIPSGRHVEIGRLGGLFRNCTNSYKFLFFLGLLEEVAAVPGDAPLLSTQNVLTRALCIGWFPHTYFKLSFGPTDQVGNVLATLEWDGFPEHQRLTPGHIDVVRAEIESQVTPAQLGLLGRYVPFRLLTPWFEPELRGLRDAQKNRAVAALSMRLFAERQPLYRVDPAGQSLQIHPDWAVYFRRNQQAVTEWAWWHWLQYMQSRNPTSPNLPGKLRPPLTRGSLAGQHRFWSTVLENGELTCIYTGQRLHTVEALDHFLPWSFILHDRGWNLVPVSAAVNSAKNDAVPAMDHLPALADAHATALTIYRERGKGWTRVASEYIEDLRLPEGALLGPPEQVAGHLLRAYRDTIGPLADLARLQGFPTQWRVA